MDPSKEKQRHNLKQSLDNPSTSLTSSTKDMPNFSSSESKKPNIPELSKNVLNEPEKLTFQSFWEWLKAKAIQKAQKYTITVILLPNIIQSLIKSAMQYYYGHEVEFVVVGIFVSLLNFMLVSYFLYKWFVTGEGGVKEITKQKLAEIQQIKDQATSYFIPGNQGNLLKLYCLLVFAGLLSYILPDALFTGGVGLVSDMYKEIKIFFMNRYQSTIEVIKQKYYQKLMLVLSSLPKYSQFMQNQSKPKSK